MDKSVDPAVSGEAALGCWGKSSQWLCTYEMPLQAPVFALWAQWGGGGAAAGTLGVSKRQKVMQEIGALGHWSLSWKAHGLPVPGGQSVPDFHFREQPVEVFSNMKPMS